MKNHLNRIRRGRVLAGTIAAAAVAALTAPALALADPGASSARATVVDLSGQTVGFAKFTEDAVGRLHVNVHVRGLTPGEHGIHLHTVGSCGGASFSGAGGHFNPYGRQHGLHNEHGHHAGDLPNLEVNRAGVGHLSAVVEGVTLTAGRGSLIDGDGSAIVVHAGPDDHVSDPAGNSGARVACGVLEER